MVGMMPNTVRAEQYRAGRRLGMVQVPKGMLTRPLVTRRRRGRASGTGERMGLGAVGHRGAARLAGQERAMWQRMDVTGFVDHVQVAGETVTEQADGAENEDVKWLAAIAP